MIRASVFVRWLPSFPLAAAWAELRSLRRAVRTWVFLGIGIAVAFTAYGYYSYLHDAVGFNPNAGYMSPRYTSAYFTIYLLWLYMAAVVFLAFDGRGRDEREGIAEVIDSRPVSNLALLAGRLGAVVLVAVVPLLAGQVLIQVVGFVAQASGFDMLGPLQGVSLVTFVLVDAVPALIVWSAFVLFLAAGLRNRLAVSGLALGLLVAHMWAFAFVPSYLLPALSPMTVHDIWASDLTPRFPTAESYAQRVSELLAAVGFMLFAASVSRRKDGTPRGRRLGVGAIAVALGVGGIATIAYRAHADLAERHVWLHTHEAAAETPDLAPDLERVQAALQLEPGKSAQLEAALHIRPRPDTTKMVFSLNPGLTIEELHLDGVPATYTFEHGLLTVARPHAVPQGDQRVLAIRAAGLLDADFAYLDSAVDWRRRSSRNGILWLGTQAGIFERRYVALMPGLHWLPVPGANVERNAGGDPFMLDLEVRVPPRWLVAAPGRREALAPGAFRFRPLAPVAQVPVFAGRFARYADMIADVEVELLVHPGHRRNIDALAPLAAPLKERLAEALTLAADLGVPYPYRTLAAVAVPGHLRGYGGGWALDSVMALPGMMLVREHGIPHGRLPEYQRPLSAEGAVQRASAYVIAMLSVPFRENSVVRAIGRNLTVFQAAARGPGATGLDFVVETLAARLVGDTGGEIATAHSSDRDAGFGATVTGMIVGLQSSGSPRSAFQGLWYHDPSSWHALRTMALVDLAASDSPLRALGALGVRGNGVATMIRDGIGRERAGALLSALRQRHGGDGYDAADFAAAARDADADLDALLGDWLHETGVPGFLVSPADVYRLTDDDEGRPRYQIRLHVRNDEPHAGLVALSPHFFAASDRRGDPVRIPGRGSTELGLVVAEPPKHFWLMPYLSLNRFPIPVALPKHVDDQAAREVPPFVGARPSDWVPPAEAGIVVDDLDPGFSVSLGDVSRLGRRDARVRPETSDQGLPTYSTRAGTWVRATIPGAWGKYRRTTAGALPGDAGAVAVFEAELPEAGRWRLDFHVPTAQVPLSVGGGPAQSWRVFGALGPMAMTVVVGGVETAVDFDGDAAEPGWNKLGEFEIGISREARLEVSTRTAGEMVLADAVRWTKVE